MLISLQAKDISNILYKYRYFDNNEYHLRLIKNLELWFTSAKMFNDCTLKYKLDGNEKLK